MHSERQYSFEECCYVLLFIYLFLINNYQIGKLKNFKNCYNKFVNPTHNYLNEPTFISDAFGLLQNKKHMKTPWHIWFCHATYYPSNMMTHKLQTTYLLYDTFLSAVAIQIAH